MNSSSIVNPLSSSSHIDNDDFLHHILSSTPWPSLLLDHHEDSPPLTSDTSIAGFSHHPSHNVDSKHQISILPLPHHHLPKDAVDSSFHSLYNDFSVAGSLPLHHPQGFERLMNQTQTQSLSQTTVSTTTSDTSAPPHTKPKVRARRGQATDPHSIAERLRRERIAERMKSLQELLPNANKTDKASMLDEIIDYVKFLQLQVKVLSVSRLGGASASASGSSQISETTDGSHGSTSCSSAANQTAENISNDGLTMTEQQVAKLMEEDMGSAMQYLQGKGLCLMPISLASTISTATYPSR